MEISKILLVNGDIIGFMLSIPHIKSGQGYIADNGSYVDLGMMFSGDRKGVELPLTCTELYHNMNTLAPLGMKSAKVAGVDVKMKDNRLDIDMGRVNSSSFMEVKHNMVSMEGMVFAESMKSDRDRALRLAEAKLGLHKDNHVVRGGYSDNISFLFAILNKYGEIEGYCLKSGRYEVTYGYHLISSHTQFIVSADEIVDLIGKREYGGVFEGSEGVKVRLYYTKDFGYFLYGRGMEFHSDTPMMMPRYKSNAKGYHELLENKEKKQADKARVVEKQQPLGDVEVVVSGGADGVVKDAVQETPEQEMLVQETPEQVKQVEKADVKPVTCKEVKPVIVYSGTVMFGDEVAGYIINANSDITFDGFNFDSIFDLSSVTLHDESMEFKAGNDIFVTKPELLSILVQDGVLCDETGFDLAVEGGSVNIVVTAEERVYDYAFDCVRYNTANLKFLRYGMLRLGMTCLKRGGDVFDGIKHSISLYGAGVNYHGNADITFLDRVVHTNVVIGYRVKYDRGIKYRSLRPVNPLKSALSVEVGDIVCREDSGVAYLTVAEAVHMASSNTVSGVFGDGTCIRYRKDTDRLFLDLPAKCGTVSVYNEDIIDHYSDIIKMDKEGLVTAKNNIQRVHHKKGGVVK